MMSPKASLRELCGTDFLLLDQFGTVSTYQADRDGEERGTKAPALNTLTCSQLHFPSQTSQNRCSQRL
jgi:hypothetical protein